jgi:aspartyl-tRNA(Asn)/glutamyl-tRNA(Gln) amidotransferase subunit B
VHAQLVSRTKLFCGCANDVGGAPNSRTCPVCLGLPGALPVLNEAVVDSALAIAIAFDARVASRTGFSRKNYFYPDLPKGYQITQFGEPLARDGHVEFLSGDMRRSVRVRQVHLEEDAGKSVHAEENGRMVSLVDMNRCGVPLVEIVTRPDIRGVEDADAFLTALRRTLLYLGVVTGRMHEGSLRFDTNVSLRRPGAEKLGTQTEIKNLNSFKAVRRALAFEIERQARVLDGGGKVRHETLLWDEASGRAAPMRSKEIASDYRYFPEPDLVDITIDERRIARVRDAMPELPDAARARLISEHGLPEYDASVITAEPETLRFYELAVAALLERIGSAAPGDARKTVSNWVMGPLGGYLNRTGTTLRLLARRRAEAGGVSTEPDAASGQLAGRFADVLIARINGEVSEPAGRRLLEEALESQETVADLIGSLGLSRVGNEDELARVVDEVLAGSPDEVARYVAGEKKLLRFFVGQVMKRTEGRADPEVAARLLIAGLGDGGED